MIAKITGKIIQKKSDCLMLEINGICYEVLIPPLIMSQVEQNSESETITLITYHYLQVDQSKSIPILIGFNNEIEKEFFELFITVSGIGPRAAMKAINKPISTIAKGINDGDINILRSLPGIGQQKAKVIIAKLQGKMGKFGLIRDSDAEIKSNISDDIVKEALSVLAQLQYKKQESKDMITKALARNNAITTTEGLLNEVYRQRVK